MDRKEVNERSVRKTFEKGKKGDIIKMCNEMNSLLNAGDPISPGGYVSTSSDEETNKTRKNFPRAPPPRAEYKTSPLSTPTKTQPFPILKSASSLPEAVVRAAVADVLHRNSRDVTLRSLRLQLQNALGADFSSDKADNMLKRIVAEEKGEAPDAKQKSFLQEMEQAREKARQKRIAKENNKTKPTPSPSPSSFPTDISSLVARHKLGLLTNSERLALDEKLAAQSQRIVRGFLGRRKAKLRAIQVEQEKEKAQRMAYERVIANAAAIEVQRVFRAWSRRKFYVELCTMKRKRKERAAVTKMQRITRGASGRRKTQTKRKHKTNAITIQKMLRQRIASKIVGKRRAAYKALCQIAAIKIQSIIRMKLAQRKVMQFKNKQLKEKKMLQEKLAAIQIQKIIRKLPCQTHLHRMRSAVRIVQLWSKRRTFNKRCTERKKKKQQELQNEEMIRLKLIQYEKEEEERRKQLLKEEEEKRKKLHRFRQRNSATTVQKIIRGRLKRKTYQDMIQIAQKSQAMYRSWWSRKQLKRKKREKKEKERQLKMTRRQEDRNKRNLLNNIQNPETTHIALSPSLPSIHQRQQPPQPLRSTRTSRKKMGKLRTSGWDEETLKSMNNKNKKTRSTFVSLSASVTAAAVAASTTTTVTASTGNPSGFNNRIPMRARSTVPSSSSSSSSVKRTMPLPGISSSSNGTNRAGSAPTGVSSQVVAGTIDDLRNAWHNARRKKEAKKNMQQPLLGRIIAKKEEDQKEKWNSLFGIKQVYESNATSIRNRMLRGGARPRKKK